MTQERSFILDALRDAGSLELIKTSVSDSIRAAIASVASDQQISNSASAFDGTFTLSEAIERDAQYSRQRLFSILFGVFSAMALGLALVGIFGLVAYSAAQRTTEFVGVEHAGRVGRMRFAGQRVCHRESSRKK
ncbi:MAG: hypothetical protein WAM85_00530 [Terracidiphilus sp.]